MCCRVYVAVCVAECVLQCILQSVCCRVCCSVCCKQMYSTHCNTATFKGHNDLVVFQGILGVLAVFKGHTATLLRGCVSGNIECIGCV